MMNQLNKTLKLVISFSSKIKFENSIFKYWKEIQSQTKLKSQNDSPYSAPLEMSFLLNRWNQNLKNHSTLLYDEKKKWSYYHLYN